MTSRPQAADRNAASDGGLAAHSTAASDGGLAAHSTAASDGGLAAHSTAVLKFFFGTMGSGKSTQALQIRHNLANSGLRVLLITQLDREEGRVSSRLGVSAEAEVISPETDLFSLARDHERAGGLDAIVCDEAQFYSGDQIEQLARVVDLLKVDVFAFGLLTSFQGVLFPGSQRLLELADERSELQVEARCFCGRRATHNARLVDGRQVYAGALKVVGDISDGRGDEAGDSGEIAYELRCRLHWHEALWAAAGHQLALPVDTGDRRVLTNTPIEATGATNLHESVEEEVGEGASS